MRQHTLLLNTRVTFLRNSTADNTSDDFHSTVRIISESVKVVGLSFVMMFCPNTLEEPKNNEPKSTKLQNGLLDLTAGEFNLHLSIYSKVARGHRYVLHRQNWEKHQSNVLLRQVGIDTSWLLRNRFVICRWEFCATSDPKKPQRSSFVYLSRGSCCSRKFLPQPTVSSAAFENFVGRQMSSQVDFKGCHDVSNHRRTRRFHCIHLRYMSRFSLAFHAELRIA